MLVNVDGKRLDHLDPVHSWGRFNLGSSVPSARPKNGLIPKL